MLNKTHNIVSIEGFTESSVVQSRAFERGFSIEFLELFRQCDIFFHFITGCEKRIMMMYRQQGLQKKYCKAEQYCSGAPHL
jgi:hypothetical protein